MFNGKPRLPLTGAALSTAPQVLSPGAGRLL